MNNAQSPLLQELARAADSHNIKDQLLVLFEREVIEAIDDIQMASRLIVTAGEMQTKQDVTCQRRMPNSMIVSSLGYSKFK
ncbi:hypothetical protein Tco_0291886 [Tanacetum coccineum]